MILCAQFANLVTVASMLTWISLCIAFIRFRKAQSLQNVSSEDPAYKAYRPRFQPYIAWTTMIFFSILVIFNGFEVFMNGNWNVNDFLVHYIGIP